MTATFTDLTQQTTVTSFDVPNLDNWEFPSNKLKETFESYVARYFPHWTNRWEISKVSIDRILCNEKCDDETRVIFEQEMNKLECFASLFIRQTISKFDPNNTMAEELYEVYQYKNDYINGVRHTPFVQLKDCSTEFKECARAHIINFISGYNIKNRSEREIKLFKYIEELCVYLDKSAEVKTYLKKLCKDYDPSLTYEAECMKIADHLDTFLKERIWNYLKDTVEMFSSSVHYGDIVKLIRETFVEDKEFDYGTFSKEELTEKAKTIIYQKYPLLCLSEVPIMINPPVQKRCPPKAKKTERASLKKTNPPNIEMMALLKKSCDSITASNQALLDVRAYIEEGKKEAIKHEEEKKALQKQIDELTQKNAELVKKNTYYISCIADLHEDNEHLRRDNDALHRTVHYITNKAQKGSNWDEKRIEKIEKQIEALYN